MERIPHNLEMATHWMQLTEALLMPLWAAVIVSSLAFGLAHSYQGVQGMMKTGFAGVVLALLYVGSGSIWLPILAHMLLDLLQGLAIRELYREPPSGDLPVRHTEQPIDG